MLVVRRSLPVVLLAVLASSPALATWSPSGNPVCTANGFQGELVGLPLTSDLSIVHSMFLCWTDARDTTYDGSNVYCGYVDPLGGTGSPNGSPMVVAPGFQGVPVAAVNGISSVTSVVVAWSDNRNGPLDVYAGSPAWPANGVPVCTAPGEQRPVRIVGEPDLGAIVAWLDSRGGAVAVYAQRLDGSGSPVWTANGLQVRAAPVSEGILKMATGPGGDAYVAWQETSAGQSHVMLQRLNQSNGSPAAGWPANGREVGISSIYGNAIDLLLPDWDGGVYVLGVSGSDLLPHAYRIDGDGSTHAGWPDGGVPLATSFIERHLDDARTFNGGLVVAWTESTDPFDEQHHLRMQRLLGDGTRAAGWGADGNVLCDAPVSQGGARLADGPALIAVWQDWRTPAAQEDIYAMRLRDDGSPDPEWPLNGVLIAGGPGPQISPRPVWDGIGGVMIAYQDGTGNWDAPNDLYVQIVSPSGRVDVPRPLAHGFALSAPVPNPASRDVRLTLSHAAAAPARVEIFDALGRRVRSLDGGAAEIVWNLRDDSGRYVEPGLYVIRARADGKETSRTVVVRR